MQQMLPTMMPMLPIYLAMQPMLPMLPMVPMLPDIASGEDVAGTPAQVAANIHAIVLELYYAPLSARHL